MLLRSLTERAVGALLGGESAVAVLHRHLIALSQSDAKQPKLCELRTELKSAIQKDIDQRTGSALRLNEISLAVESLPPVSG